MSVTRTTNPLPFTDLKPSRFEDLCLGIVFRLHNWKSIKHHGRKGKEKGVDIYTELVIDGGVQRWFIQCKNYKNISLSEIKAIIDDVTSRNKQLPDEYRLILSCDVSREDWEKIVEYAHGKGLSSIDITTGSVLETILFSQHHDLLYIFFGIDVMHKKANAMTNIKRRIAMKKKTETEYWAKKPSEIIVRDVHQDNTYPDSNYYDCGIGISPWFKAEVLRPYYRGLSLIVGIEQIQINEDRSWRVIKAGETAPAGAFFINAFVIGNIPYDSIVAIDWDGDEYYNFPHVYCEYTFAGQPYEEVWYWPTDDYKEFKGHLHKDKQIIVNASPDESVVEKSPRSAQLKKPNPQP